jgi:hypothetical protein
MLDRSTRNLFQDDRPAEPVEEPRHAILDEPVIPGVRAPTTDPSAERLARPPRNFMIPWLAKPSALRPPWRSVRHFLTPVALVFTISHLAAGGCARTGASAPSAAIPVAMPRPAVPSTAPVERHTEVRATHHRPSPVRGRRHVAAPGRRVAPRPSDGAARISTATARSSTPVYRAPTPTAQHVPARSRDQEFGFEN